MIYIIVGIAGILGALSRYYLGLTIDMFWHHSLPFATLTINLIGCFLLAWLTTYIARLNILPSEVITGIGTGFIGSFTTFSTFSVETVKLINHSELGIAFLYVLCSMLGGLIMSGLGYKLGNLSLQKRLGEGGKS
ncbi:MULTISPECIES: fluoride efflux transporter CrcB [Bacillus]|uniref:fluoride efflux transporter CrcB n=1 Tax=Bacillus TaxID=1386 RepID=UPI0006541AE3|nr:MULTISPECIES: fluoride efflux transporter CrcB [Bacillus]KMN46724.1 camphor resistance protein CrcB [Bacillus sp. LK2]MCW9132957.1 fluoride efflux transporter CrcB [Bacillus paramycoides]MED0967605.1 fluoride efflux transporter CrcB [Bacillus paramycoides]MED0978194.1 fluoride efflux transporter CrcB [Bacillus paramycoides]MED1092368.1 fluoride efflux transporter CrcB [Bacillus paramycoides]